MSRTIKSVKRPDEHLYVEDPDEPADHRDNKPCGHLLLRGRCGLPRTNSVHVTAAELLPPTPAGDVSDRILGEGGEAT